MFTNCLFQGGPKAPEKWQGCMNFSYNLGGVLARNEQNEREDGGEVRVNIDLNMSYQRRDIYNVIAKIPGELEVDRYVLLGHY